MQTQACPNVNMSKPPSRHLIAVLTYLALIPLVYFVPEFISQYVTTNRLLVTLLALGVIVPVVSYWVLPLLLGLVKLFKVPFSQR